MREASGAELSTTAALVTLQTMTDGGSIDELRRVLGLSHSGGVRVVQTLRDGGLVVQERDPADGRAVRLRLTNTGHEAAHRIRQARLETLGALLGALTPAQQAELDGLFADILSGATGDRTDARHICRLCDPGVCGHPTKCPVTLAADVSQDEADS
jgi:MarR family transcriptional repressor of emrRAB